MKHTKKIVTTGVVLTALLGFAYYVAQLPPRIIHYKVALEEFEQRKKLIADYYLTGAYENDIAMICKKAEDYFATIPVTEKSVIVFDIDDTALYRIQQNDSLAFVWERIPLLKQARAKEHDPAIKPVLALYKKLVERGFTIVFMSGRGTNLYNQTIKNLQEEGYTTYKEVILFPDELYKIVELDVWKGEQREKLAMNYEIIGNVGDRHHDFVGGYTGHCVKLPNYLY